MTTNIIILSLQLVTNNQSQMSFTAPKGVYQVEYNQVAPQDAVSGKGRWAPMNVNHTNTVDGIKVILFDIPSNGPISFRVKKIV